jgi:hypothetical protein
MAIPAFRDNGYLPIGVHKATEAEVAERFGSTTLRRRQLMDRIGVWLAWARAVHAQKFVVDGSFVTIKDEPNDVDCVCWLAPDFQDRYQWGQYEAVRLHGVIDRGEPKELFATGSSAGWQDWISFFCQTRELDGRRKGIIEVLL